MARTVSGAEISERFLSLSKAYRGQADLLKVKKEVRQKATLTASIRHFGNAHLLPQGSSYRKYK
jgi:hypothetical protein